MIDRDAAQSPAQPAALRENVFQQAFELELPIFDPLLYET
jgi:hypothetical protein